MVKRLKLWENHGKSHGKSHGKKLGTFQKMIGNSEIPLRLQHKYGSVYTEDQRYKWMKQSGDFAADGLAGLFPSVYDWYMFEWFIEQFQDFTIQIGEKS